MLRVDPEPVTPMPATPPPVVSPCVDVCRLDREQQVCTGCGRALGEIAAWGAAGDDERRRIRDRAAQRLAIMRARAKQESP